MSKNLLLFFCLLYKTIYLKFLNYFNIVYKTCSQINDID